MNAPVDVKDRPETEVRTGHAGAVDVREAALELGPWSGITPEERYLMIAEAAYFRAERRSFAAGGELDDWVQAESEIDRLMQSGGSRARRADQVA